MYVRVASSVSGSVYQSMVYAIVGDGEGAKYIVLNPYANELELAREVVISNKERRTLVSVIQTNTDGFETYTGSQLLRYKHYCKTNMLIPTELFSLCGYPDVCENYAFLYDILTNKKIPFDRYNIQLRDIPDAHEWSYIRTQKDADDFMDLFFGFHDSKLVSVEYSQEEGKREATAVFDNSGWFGVAELCFEGVQLLKIVPPYANGFADIYDATLIVDADGVFWADEYMEKPDESCDASVIRAFSLKWRKK
ncbi:MAG: hypothetical protein IJU52_06245 [Clostridia bacterium]|nr:hypothetical protein [Clostridia bacterium]